MSISFNDELKNKVYFDILDVTTEVLNQAESKSEIETSEELMKAAKRIDATFDSRTLIEVAGTITELCRVGAHPGLKSLAKRLITIAQSAIAQETAIRSSSKTTAVSEKRPKSVSERIERHNQKALSELSEFDGFYSYPLTKEEKKAARAEMEAAKKSNLNTAINSLSKQLESASTANVASTQGKRDYMEDRWLADTVTFQANGKTYSADLFGVFDGHGGEDAVDYVTDHLVKRLQELLRKRLGTKDLNDEAIFYALKETISSLHEDCISERFNNGTTAALAFKIHGINELWTANIGDSFAYLNRNGQTIPMSIEQKASFDGVENRSVTFDRPNKYARELMKNGVGILGNAFKIEKEFKEAVSKGLSPQMVMSYQYTTRDNIHEMMLGVKDVLHLDMARSIGDPDFDQWTKHTPEIFKQPLFDGDQLIMHTDGVKTTPKAVVKVIQNDKNSGCSIEESLGFIVNSSIAKGDNICAMIVTLGNKSPQGQFWELVNKGVPDQLKAHFLELEKTDKPFFTSLCANAYFIEHDAWIRNGKRGSEPGGPDYGKFRMLDHLKDPVKNRDRIKEIASYKRKS